MGDRDAMTGRFRPGNHANPRGRPKGRGAREVIRKHLLADGGAKLIDWLDTLLADPGNASKVVDLLKWLDGAEPPVEDEGGGSRHDRDLEALIREDDAIRAALGGRPASSIFKIDGVPADGTHA